MQRETKTHVTPEGKQLVVKSYLTAGERNSLRAILLAKMKINADGSNDASGVDGSVVDASEAKLIEIAVVSYDGSAENIAQRLLDSKPAEYDFAVARAGEANTGNLTSAK